MRSERLGVITEDLALPDRVSFFRLLRPSQCARVVFVNTTVLERCSGYVRSPGGYVPVTPKAGTERTNMVIWARDPLACRLKTSPGHGDTN